jgi:hypothetical protein
MAVIEGSEYRGGRAGGGPPLRLESAGGVVGDVISMRAVSGCSNQGTLLHEILE